MLRRRHRRSPYRRLKRSSPSGSVRMLIARSAPIWRARASGVSARSVATTSRAPACRATSTAKRADRPGPGHQHAPAQKRPGLRAAVQAHRERLGQGGMLHREPVGRSERPALPRRPSTSRKPPCTCGKRIALPKNRMSRQWSRLALAAIAALPAGPARIDRDPVARPDAASPHRRPPGPRRRSRAPAIRLLDAHRAEAAVMIVVQVRAADPAGPDPHTHLARDPASGAAVPSMRKSRGAWMTSGAVMGLSLCGVSLRARRACRHRRR